MDGINSDEDFEEKENIFYNGIHCSFVLNQLIPIPTNLSTPKKNKKGGGGAVQGSRTPFVFLFMNILYIFFLEAHRHYFHNLHQNLRNQA